MAFHAGIHGFVVNELSRIPIKFHGTVKFIVAEWRHEWSNRRPVVRVNDPSSPSGGTRPREVERIREGGQPSRGELITGFHEACPGARVSARRKPRGPDSMHRKRRCPPHYAVQLLRGARRSRYPINRRLFQPTVISFFSRGNACPVSGSE